MSPSSGSDTESDIIVVHPSIKLAERLDKETSRAEDRLTILEGTIKYLTHGMHNDLDRCDATRLYRTGITRVRTLDEIARVEEAEVSSQSNAAWIAQTIL